MRSFIMPSNVSVLRLSTGTMKKLRLPRSMPPNTHWPSTIRPQLCFLLPTFASSISTILPGPPIVGRPWVRLQSTYTSRRKFFQSTTDERDQPTWNCANSVSPLTRTVSHATNWQLSLMLKFAPSKKVFVRTLSWKEQATFSFILLGLIT